MLATFIVALMAMPYLPGGMVSYQAQGSTTHIFGLVDDWDPLPSHPQVPNTKGAFVKFDCQRHDPTLGTLQSVDIFIWKRSKFRWQIENLYPTGPPTQIVWLYKKAEWTLLEGQIHHWALYQSPWSGFSALGYGWLLAPFDGLLDFAGPSGHTGHNWSGWEKAQKTYTQALLLDDFTGRGPMPMELTVRTGFYTSSLFQSEVGRLDGTSFVRVLVRYNY